MHSFLLIGIHSDNSEKEGPSLVNTKVIKIYESTHEELVMSETHPV